MATRSTPTPLPVSFWRPNRNSQAQETVIGGLQSETRNRKVVDYSQFGDVDDNDEDFASTVGPSHKKLKSVSSELKEKKKVLKEELLKKRSPNKRVTLDDKLYQRHLEVALALSINEPSLSSQKVQGSQEQGGSTNECGTTIGNSRQEAATAKQKLQTKGRNGDSTDSYEPETASAEESEGDSSYSEDDHDEFVMKKKIKQNRKEGEKLKVEIRKQATKPSKQKKNCMITSQPVQKASNSPEPIGKPLKTSSPLAAKKPTWIPPAASGSRANQLSRVPVTSPTQGLRLGLSRLARVKPLHPGFAST